VNRPSTRASPLAARRSRACSLTGNLLSSSRGRAVAKGDEAGGDATRAVASGADAAAEADVGSTDAGGAEVMEADAGAADAVDAEATDLDAESADSGLDEATEADAGAAASGGIRSMGAGASGRSAAPAIEMAAQPSRRTSRSRENSVMRSSRGGVGFVRGRARPCGGARSGERGGCQEWSRTGTGIGLPTGPAKAARLEPGALASPPVDQKF
jgi:hypothetical protein